MILNVSAKLLPFAYGIIGFCLVIVIHEFGHFIFAKLFNIHTPTFSIGMGPKLIERKIGTTSFRLSALPLGGYVELAGLEEVGGQGEQKHARASGSASFSSKKYWQKFLVLMGGITFNVLFAYLALMMLFVLGAPKHDIRIKNVQKESPAAMAGLKKDDIILSINAHNLQKHPELLMRAVQHIQKNGENKIAIRVIRNGKEREVLVTRKPPVKTLGIEFHFTPSRDKECLPVKEAISKGIHVTNGYIYQTIVGLSLMFKKRSLKGAGGPVMIISETMRHAQHGIGFLVIFLAIISVTLAITNLLPLPVLDGGQLLFITIETLIGRQIPIMVKNAIHVASLIFLLVLTIYLTYGDVLYLIRGGAR